MKKFLGEELTNGKTLYRESLVKLEKMIESLSDANPRDIVVVDNEEDKSKAVFMKKDYLGGNFVLVAYVSPDKRFFQFGPTTQFDLKGGDTLEADFAEAISNLPNRVIDIEWRNEIVDVRNVVDGKFTVDGVEYKLVTTYHDDLGRQYIYATEGNETEIDGYYFWIKPAPMVVGEVEEAEFVVGATIVIAGVDCTLTDCTITFVSEDFIDVANSNGIEARYTIKKKTPIKEITIIGEKEMTEAAFAALALGSFVLLNQKDYFIIDKNIEQKYVYVTMPETGDVVYRINVKIHEEEEIKYVSLGEIPYSDVFVGGVLIYDNMELKVVKRDEMFDGREIRIDLELEGIVKVIYTATMKVPVYPEEYETIGELPYGVYGINTWISVPEKGGDFYIVSIADDLKSLIASRGNWKVRFTITSKPVDPTPVEPVLLGEIAYGEYKVSDVVIFEGKDYMIYEISDEFVYADALFGAGGKFKFTVATKPVDPTPEEPKLLGEVRYDEYKVGSVVVFETNEYVVKEILEEGKVLLATLASDQTKVVKFIVATKPVDPTPEEPKLLGELPYGDYHVENIVVFEGCEYMITGITKEFITATDMMQGKGAVRFTMGKKPVEPVIVEIFGEKIDMTGKTPEEVDVIERMNKFFSKVTYETVDGVKLYRLMTKAENAGLLTVETFLVHANKVEDRKLDFELPTNYMEFVAKLEETVKGYVAEIKGITKP